MSNQTASTHLFRLCALAGVYALCLPFTWSNNHRPDSELLYFLIGAVASLVVLLIPVRSGARTLRHHPDLLVPFGCYQLALLPLEWLPIESQTVSWMVFVGSPFDLAMPVLAVLLLRLVIGSLYVAWQTLVIIQAITSNGVDLAGELRHAVSLIPRTMAIVAIAYTGLLLPFLLAIWLPFPELGSGLYAFMGLIFFWGLFWGYRTCLWLPVALDRSEPLTQGLRNANAAGREIWSLRPIPVFAWALALGLLCVHVFRTGSQSFGNSQTNFKVLPQWYGDYLHENKWYLELVSDAEVAPLGFYALPLAVLSICLAIAVKATLVQHIDGPVPKSEFVEVSSLPPSRSRCNLMQVLVDMPIHRTIAGLFTTALLALAPTAQTAPAGQTSQSTPSISAKIDAYLDERCEGSRAATNALLADLRAQGITEPARIEALLRAPRHQYPDVSELLGKTTVQQVDCYHVDHTARVDLFVPKSYDRSKATPLVVVGHGGNSSMSDTRAARVARSYLRAYAPAMSQELGAIVVAPHTTRGWGHIGNSLILSTISDLSRRLHIDPDRIYATGQSMGGHMAFRAALIIGDRFGAVSPQSGGYDFVKKGTIGNLRNVPGYVTWGKREPYGIDRDSRTNAAWAQQHKLDWLFVEKPGGHEIYADEQPKIARFFKERPRNLYRKQVYTRLGGTMKFTKTWGVKGWPKHVVRHESRPLRWNQQHWLELTPRPDHKEPQIVRAQNRGNNQFVILSSQARELFVHLHPDMVDFDKPVRITVNGKQLFDAKVEPDLVHMLEHVREFDDRGRIFWARVRVAVTTDSPVDEDTGK